MYLEGSCHCGAVRFGVESPHPYPYQRCYCSICRKTAGGGGRPAYPEAPWAKSALTMIPLTMT